MSTEKLSPAGATSAIELDGIHPQGVYAKYYSSRREPRPGVDDHALSPLLRLAVLGGTRPCLGGAIINKVPAQKEISKVHADLGVLNKTLSIGVRQPTEHAQTDNKSGAWTFNGQSLIVIILSFVGMQPLSSELI